MFFRGVILLRPSIAQIVRLTPSPRGHSPTQRVGYSGGEGVLMEEAPRECQVTLRRISRSSAGQWAHLDTAEEARGLCLNVNYMAHIHLTVEQYEAVGAAAAIAFFALARPRIPNRLRQTSASTPACSWRRLVSQRVGRT